MSTKNDAKLQSIRQIKDKIEDYTTTILALQCFIGAATWDNNARQRLSGAKDSMGRRMDTTEKNRVSPSTTVTPDAVIQRSPELGYVVEAKKSMPLDQEYWRQTVQQMEKYDDELKGWWYEPISVICVVMLMHISRTADFSKYVMLLLKKKEVGFVNPTSIIEFTKSSEGREYLFVRKSWGKIEDGAFAKQLVSGIPVPIEDVLASSGKRKFYDSRPEVEYTMYILWQDLFHPQKIEVQYDEKLKAYPLPVNVNDTTAELQRLYGSPGGEPRDVAFPQNAWIQEALDAFVNLGLATNADGNGNYIILFKSIRADLIERFSKHREKVSKQLAPPEQLKLLTE